MLGVVIPTLNEAACIADAIADIRYAARGCDVRLIVSDCKSPDGTADIARAVGAIVVTGGVSRATALNRGAAALPAEVDRILFLHADTTPPLAFATAIARALTHGDVVGGAFDFKFRSHPGNRGLNRRLLQLVTLANRVRFRNTREFFGDQGIFVRRQVFERLGGFPDLPLLEDLYFSRALRRAGRTAILNPPTRTSPRRFTDRGILRQFGQDLLLLSAESLGVRPTALWHAYNHHNAAAAPPGPPRLTPRASVVR